MRCFGSAAWAIPGVPDSVARVIEEQGGIPTPIMELRQERLVDLVNPLLFVCGPWKAWTKFGPIQERCKADGPSATADVTQMQPAPLGRFFTGRLGQVPPGSDDSDTALAATTHDWEARYKSRFKIWPTLNYGNCGLPYELSLIHI